MKILTTTILFTTLFCNAFCQETEKFAKKITDSICICLGNVKKYENLKPKLDSCYDKTFNQTAIHATPDEIKIIGNVEALTKTRQSISKLIKTDCDVVRKLAEKEAQTSTTNNPYPTNFDIKELKKAKKNLNKWDGKIVAFDAEILEVYFPSPNKPYLKVTMNKGQIIWIGSMTNSIYDKVGNKIRFLGYFVLTTKDDISQNYNDLGFQILAFGEIDHKTKQLSFMPGSESQIKEWGSGQIPRAKE